MTKSNSHITLHNTDSKYLHWQAKHTFYKRHGNNKFTNIRLLSEYLHENGGL